MTDRRTSRTSTTGRRAVHGYIDKDSYALLETFGEANGVSITAQIQTFADELGEEMEATGTTDIRPGFVKKCRAVDAQRRRR